MSERIQGIRDRLAKATPGPWARDPYDRASCQVIARGNEVIAYHHRHERQIDSRVVANYELMAAAPSDIGFLLSEIERLTEEIETLRGK